MGLAQRAWKAEAPPLKGSHSQLSLGYSIKQLLKNSWGIWQDLFTNLQAGNGRAGLFGRLLYEQKSWLAPFPSSIPQCCPIICASVNLPSQPQLDLSVFPGNAGLFSQQAIINVAGSQHLSLSSPAEFLPSFSLGLNPPKVVPQAWQCISSHNRGKHYSKMTMALRRWEGNHTCQNNCHPSSALRKGTWSDCWPDTPM